MSKHARRRLIFASILATACVAASLAFAAGYHRAAYRYLNVFREVWALTNANYVEPVDESGLLTGAYQGMLASLDAASGYLTPEHEKLVRAPRPPARAGFEVLPSGGVPVVVRVDPGSPAADVGLAVGDQLWSIDGTSTRNVPWPVASRLIAGEPGSKLELDVFDASEFRLQRFEVALEEPAGPGFRLESMGGALLLRLGDLDRLDTLALAKDLREGRAAEPQAPLLVDLRGVVGLDPAIVSRLAGILHPGGELLRLTPREGTPEQVSAPEAGKVLAPDNLFVLVDSTTAGTGEAIALLMIELRGARSVGRKTYGLGAIPEIIPLRSGGSVLLTTREMQTGRGTTWAGEGLEPERTLDLRARPGDTDEGEQVRDPMLEQALDWIAAGAPAEAEELPVAS